MYDVIIIGAGPAGISASLYAKRANLDVLVLYKGESSLWKAEKIENYYGFTNGIKGSKLYEDGIEQARNLGIEVKETEVIGIQNKIETFEIKTENEIFESKAVILSTGNKKVRPNIAGVTEFEGRGVSYCAICDAFFYRKKNVVVIGDGKFAISEAEELSHVAESVTILTDGKETLETKFDVNNKKIKAILGEQKVEKIEFEDGSILKTDGVFIALGEAGASDFAKKMGLQQEGDNIIVNDKMETNVKGVYACGNITVGLQQICKAVYEGAQAGISVANFVRNKSN